jgi:uncharacterized protein
MSGSKDLNYLLKEANPVLDSERYVFVCRPAMYGDYAEWQPVATFLEDEGLTLVIRQGVADAHALSYHGVFQKISFDVHSSLNAVGLTAKFAQCLAARNISANVFAAYYHDHIFVPLADSERAMSALASVAEH